MIDLERRLRAYATELPHHLKTRGITRDIRTSIDLPWAHYDLIDPEGHKKAAEVVLTYFGGDRNLRVSVQADDTHEHMAAIVAAQFVHRNHFPGHDLDVAVSGADQARLKTLANSYIAERFADRGDGILRLKKTS